MGRCGGWRIGVVLLLAVVGASCGGTGGKGSPESGNPLVFETRGRLNLIVQPTDDPRILILQAALFDPQGVPFQNHSILFSAEFSDATFIPGNDNQGAVLTDNNGQAKITLIAGLTTGHMRIVAEAFNLNLLTGVTVKITEQGFVSQGDLGIIPSLVTFVNPAVNPTAPTMTIFNAVGGTPPYRWDNGNKSLGTITPIGLANINEQAEYTLASPLPSATDGLALLDTITLLDTDNSQATANVEVLFAQCNLFVTPTTINIGGAVGGEEARITIEDGVPPFSVTQTFPDSGSISIDQDAGIVTFTVATPPIAVAPDTLLIRDSRGCTAMVEVTIEPAPGPQVTNIVLTANPTRLIGFLGGMSVITAGVFDENNLPIEGIEVLFQIEDGSPGSLNSLTATTDAEGEAVVTFTIPPLTPAGTATIIGSARNVFGEEIQDSVIINILGPGDLGLPDGDGDGFPDIPLPPSPPGAAASIECVSAEPTTIGVIGSGLPEQSVLTFRVTDSEGVPVVGATVNFFVTSLGGESVSPTMGVTDSEGMVQTTVTSGVRANDVQVTATVDVDGDGQFDVVTMCTLVTIVGAPPVQGSLSLAREFANVAGRVTSGLQDGVTAFLADRFGNPVPPETAVSFSTNGGLIPGQGLTDEQGQATSSLQTQAPIPPEGLVIVMAHTLGQEPFIDNNGNGVWDPGEPVEDVPEPFIDRNGNCTFDQNDPFEIFIDVNGNGVWDAVQGTPDTWDNQIFVWDAAPVMFSAETVATVVPTSFTIPNGGSQTFELFVSDPDGNPITSASSISISITGGGQVSPSSFQILDATNCPATPCGNAPESFNPADCRDPSDPASEGITRFEFTVSDTDPDDTDMPENSTVEITIDSAIAGTAPGGNGSVVLTASGTVD